MKFAVTVVLVAVALEATAHAYVDPGTGTLVLQALVGGALGAMFYFRKGMSKLTSLFRRSRGSDEPRG